MKRKLQNAFIDAERYARRKNIYSLSNFSKASSTFLTSYPRSKVALIDLPKSKIKRRKSKNLIVPIGI